jgi:hypothetical protein
MLTLPVPSVFPMRIRIQLPKLNADPCTQPANSQLIPQSMMKYLVLARLAKLIGVS